MKVLPELLDHPKFLRLERLVGDRALKYLLRLWAHCESNQRGERWKGADAEYVEIICRFDGEKNALYSALVSCGFVDEFDGYVRIHDWDRTNWRAVTNWKIGKSGGRKPAPKESPTHNPTETLGFSKAKPKKTQSITPLNEGMNEYISTPLPPAGESARVGRNASRNSDSLFDLFWDVYPKKVGKMAARRAWERARRAGAPVERFGEIVAAHKESDQWREQGGRFVPNPATWLNQGRWEDGPCKKSGAGVLPELTLEEPPGWRDLLGAAAPEMNLPSQFGLLPESARKWAWELFRKENEGGEREDSSTKENDQGQTRREDGHE